MSIASDEQVQSVSLPDKSLTGYAVLACIRGAFGQAYLQVMVKKRAISQV